MAKEFNYKILGKTGLKVTEVGFGGYRIDVRSPMNLEALKKALVSGINLIDTSANYTNGNSELLIGDVVKDLVDSGRVSRDSLVIVTKAGYLQGENLEISQERKQENNPFPELVEFNEGLEHCIHPDFLEEQITMSLERMELETIDVFLLHNPEYYLKWAKNNNIDQPAARKEYYARIKKAFEYLEQEVQTGRIKYYGISSNTFPIGPDEYEATSLEKVLEIAVEISENNHFSVIQFPMNLAEAGKNAIKILQLAKENNLGVLINRPLNAIYDNKLITLAEPPVFNPPDKKQVNESINTILELEKSVAKKLKVFQDKDFASKIEQCLYVGNELHEGWADAKNIAVWDAILKQYFLPKLRACNNLMKKSSFKDEDLEMELYGITYKLGRLYGSITAYYNSKHLEFVAKMRNNLAKAAPELAEIDKLSKMAIRALRSTEGVSCVLVGMTHPPYVNDVVSELKEPALGGFDWGRIKFVDLIERNTL